MINKNSHKQTGSAHVAIVAILVILLIGALGYIFWQNYSAKNAQVSSSTETNSSSSQQNSSVESDQVERYVTLEDWGVKFKIDDTLKDTTIAKTISESGDSYLFFSERLERAFMKACPSFPHANSGAGWNVIRHKEKTALDGELLNDVAINGYFYVAGKTGTACPGEYSPAASDDTDYSGDSDAVLASLQTLQPVK